MAYYSPADDISFVPLTIEEEVSLFQRFYSGDIAARDILIKNHLKLAAKLALQVSGKGGIPDEDAISSANFGLIQALESRCFDPARGLRFATYLRKYVFGQVMSALRERVDGFDADEYKLDHQANDACVTGVRADDLEQFRGTGSGPSAKKILDDQQATAPINEELDLSAVRREKLLDAIETLPESERLALRAHYFEGRNFADIARHRNRCRPSGDTHRTTREGIRKAHNRGLCKLKHALAHLEPELS